MPPAEVGGDLVEVRLLALPVPLWAQAQEHFAALTREFALIASADEVERSHVPSRLLEMVDQLTMEYGEFSVEQEQQIQAAADRGEPALDVDFRVPAAARAAIDDLEALLDEADEFCRQGEHLLTLETPEQCVRYRRWYLAQFRDQLSGAAPVAWPDWSGPAPGSAPRG